MTYTPTRTRKNPEARAAALQWAAQITQAEIDAIPEIEILTENVAELEARVNTGVLEQTIGELLMEARKSRGLGKREFARRLGTNHARISQLEAAGNLELNSILSVLEQLDYDLSIQFISRKDGKVIGAVIPV